MSFAMERIGGVNAGDWAVFGMHSQNVGRSAGVFIKRKKQGVSYGHASWRGRENHGKIMDFYFETKWKGTYGMRSVVETRAIFCSSYGNGNHYRPSFHSELEPNLVIVLGY